MNIDLKKLCYAEIYEEQTYLPHDVTYKRTQNKEDLKISNNPINNLANEMARLSKGEVQQTISVQNISLCLKQKKGVKLNRLHFIQARESKIIIIKKNDKQKQNQKQTKNK